MQNPFAGQSPSWPGTWANIMNGQAGGQTEMQAHGLSSAAAPTAGLPSGLAAGQSAQQPDIQSMLQTALGGNSMSWLQMLNPASLLKLLQQQYPQLGQQAQLQSGQAGNIPQSFFSHQSLTPWQQPPAQA
jgi:hypothetical protein